MSNNAEKIIQKIMSETSIDMIHLTLEKRKPNIFDSKVGGAFYVPSNDTLPVNKKTGEPLYLLAQLNFSELPKLPSFPDKGLLQFFISGDDLYGMSFDDPTKQEGFMIRFIKELPKEVPVDCIHTPKWDDEMLSPLSKDSEYVLNGEIKKQALPYNDYRYDLFLEEQCRDILPEDCISFYDLADEVSDAIIDQTPTYCAQIGGYPFFTQADPRELENQDYDILLFQLDSVEDIMWGDSGVGNFFIKKSDLEKEDFSNVLYNWDCY